MRAIKFISYNGKYPTLCFGTLVYSVDNEQHTVKSPAVSGGSAGVINGDEYCTSGKWKLDRNEFEHLTKEEFMQLEDEFNKKVRQGCCGGCI